MRSRLLEPLDPHRGTTRQVAFILDAARTLAEKHIGQGMSPADLKRVAARFGHVEDEASRERPDIGLGYEADKSAYRVVHALRIGTYVYVIGVFRKKRRRAARHRKK